MKKLFALLALLTMVAGFVSNTEAKGLWRSKETKNDSDTSGQSKRCKGCRGTKGTGCRCSK